MADQPTGELRTPDEWCRIQGVQVRDPDGWRGRNGRPWEDPISLAEFQERLATCTQRVSRNHPWCDEPDCTVCDAGERRTDTLDLAGQGNRALSPISDAAADAAARIFYGRAYGSVGDKANKVLLDGAREALEAAYPPICQQIAHEIAQALEQLDSPRYARDLSSGLGWTLISRDIAIQTVLDTGKAATA